LPIHKCNDADYAEFYAPSYNVEQNMKQFNALKPYLFCVNDTDVDGNALENNTFFGPNDGSFNKRIDIKYKPCTPKMLTDENRHEENRTCLADLNDKDSVRARLEKSIKYLGEPEFKLVYNS